MMSRVAWELVAGPGGAIKTLRTQIGEILRDLNAPNPTFEYRLAWSESYDALFRNEPSKITDVSELYSIARRSGRVILCARGGGAKTVILHRIAKLAFDAGHIPILVDLKKWNELSYHRWNSLRDDGLERAAFLLSELATPSVELSIIERLPPEIPRTILVDGLNEIRFSTGNAVLTALDTFVRRSLNTSTIVTDRLVRRDPPNPDRWQYATILPLESAEIRRHIQSRFRSSAHFDSAEPQTKALLSIPYFLNVLLKEGRVGTSGSQALSDYFLRHVSLSPGELAEAANAAFLAYSEDQSRVFSVSDFSANSSVDIWQKLQAAGAVATSNGNAFFTHHLKHDYLASTHVAAREDRWHRAAFGVISLGASSFDGIAFALEQLQTSESADLFVRRVYDWNPYAASYATAEGMIRLSVKVSHQMQVVLLAMLAERRWDLIEATAQRASDALSIFPGDDARAASEAGSLQAIFDFVSSFPEGPDWFQRWRELFTLPIRSGATDSTLALLSETDSIMGWTAANVLKRLALAESQQRSLRADLATADLTTRWRIAHVLGAFPTRANAEALLQLLDNDADEWVRYGAIRSLVELAALSASPDLRRFIFEQLCLGVATLATDRRRLEEFEKAIFIRNDKAPDDWLTTAGAVVDSLYNHTTDLDRKERWIQLAHTFAGKYRLSADG